MATASNISKKRKHVAEGVFRAELDGFLRKELAEDGYSGVEVHIGQAPDFAIENNCVRRTSSSREKSLNSSEKSILEKCKICLLCFLKPT